MYEHLLGGAAEAYRCLGLAGHIYLVQGLIIDRRYLDPKPVQSPAAWPATVTARSGMVLSAWAFQYTS
jgi:hypothetical protein